MNLGYDDNRIEKIYDNLWALDGDTGILGFCINTLRRKKENKYIRYVATEKYLCFIILNILSYMLQLLDIGLMLSIYFILEFIMFCEQMESVLNSRKQNKLQINVCIAIHITKVFWKRVIRVACL